MQDALSKAKGVKQVDLVVSVHRKLVRLMGTKERSVSIPGRIGTEGSVQELFLSLALSQAAAAAPKPKL